MDLKAPIRSTEETIGPINSQTVVPEEVWRIIFGYLDDPGDLWRCSLTCRYFEEVLSKWRTGWMLGKTLPHIYKHLPGNKLLKCRLVCKSWDRIIRNFLENHPSLRPYSCLVDHRKLEIFNPIIEKNLCRRNEFTFSTLTFKSTPLPQGPDPFIGRYVILNIGKGCLADGKDEKLWNSVDDFLNSFGLGIWYLSLTFPTIQSKEVQNRVLRLLTLNLFQFTPNLRKLRICQTRFGRNNSGKLDPDSLPPAPNLESIESYNTCGKDNILDALLARYQKQLGHLHLTGETLMRTEKLEWYSLTELHLTGPIDFQGLLRANMPQLRKLGINLNCMRDVTIAGLLEVVNELSTKTRLEALRLDGYHLRLFSEQIDRERVRVKTLKTLEIGHYIVYGQGPSYSNLICSGCFPDLENLHLFMRKNEDFWWQPGRQSEIGLMSSEECLKRMMQTTVGGNGLAKLDKCLYWGNVYNSDIWEKLPNLKVFSFQWDVYTRYEYDKYCKL